MIRDLMALTLRKPREGMRAVLNLGLDDRTRWMALVAVAVVTTIIATLIVQVAGTAMPEAALYPTSPIATAIAQTGIMAAGAVLVFLLGRAAGGQGRLGDAVLVVVWLQVFLIALQLLQIAAALLVPFLAPVIFLGAIAAFFWLLTHFVAEAHGFRSLFLVFAAILGAIILLSILLAPVLAPLLGLEAPGV
jgi:hypothetical protein